MTHITLLLFSEDVLMAMLDKGRVSNALVPMLDPTLFMMGGVKLQGVMQLVKATLTYRRAVEGAFETLTEGERKAQAYRNAGVGRDL